MNDFEKAKIAFALALAALLIALGQLVPTIGEYGFDIFSVKIKIVHAYYTCIILLVLSVYAYSVDFVRNREDSRLRKAGNVFYILSVLVPPAYALLGLVKVLSLFAVMILKSEVASRIGAGLLNVVIVYISVRLAKGMTRTVEKREKLSTLIMMIGNVDKKYRAAMQLFESKQYGFSVVESMNALETALQVVLRLADVEEMPKSTDKAIEEVSKKKLLPEKTLEQVKNANRLRNEIIHKGKTAPQVTANGFLLVVSKVMMEILTRNTELGSRRYSP